MNATFLIMMQELVKLESERLNLQDNNSKNNHILEGIMRNLGNKTGKKAILQVMNDRGVVDIKSQPSIALEMLGRDLFIFCFGRKPTEAVMEPGKFRVTDADFELFGRAATDLMLEKLKIYVTALFEGAASVLDPTIVFSLTCNRDSTWTFLFIKTFPDRGA